MSAEIIHLATAFRPLKGATWPLPEADSAVEIEVRCSNYRVRRWRWTQPLPDHATHWRLPSPTLSAAQPAT